MRTQDEIVQQIERRRANDFLGFELPMYIDCLDYEHAKPFLKEGVTEAEWDYYATDEQIKTRMKNYMEFAWNKANGFRGISASRSMMHYYAWLWLLNDGFWETIKDELENYEYYGKPQLRKICKHLGLDASRWDDGIRVNSESELE